MSGPNTITRARARQCGQSFHPFPKLPIELRRKIWSEAMPRHGIHPVICQVAEVEDGIDSVAPTMTMALHPLPANAAGPDFTDRIRKFRTLLNICRESRTEVKFRFPDTLEIDGGEMRFSGERDVVLITAFGNMDDALMSIMLLNAGPAADLQFDKDWNKVVQKLAIDSPIVEAALGNPVIVQNSPMFISDRAVDTFLKILVNIDKLKHFFLVGRLYAGVAAWNKASGAQRAHCADHLTRLYTTGSAELPVEEQDHKPSGFHRLRCSSLCKSLMSTARLIHIIRNIPETASLPLSPGIKIGYPELDGMEIDMMVSTEPALQYLCKEMEF